LFHANPENFVTGSYIKIGFFETDDDLKYQDEIHGNLLEQIEKTMDLLFTKYSKAIISYEGINRVEKYEYPKDAVREALLNAIAHKDYSGVVPIQISVYSDKIIFWNEGQLPENWTVKNLLEKHASRPYNPDVANALFRSGYIESWGRGTLKMIRECKLVGLPEPVFSYESSDISVEFRKDIYNEKYLKSLNLNNRQVKAVLFESHSERSGSDRHSERSEGVSSTPKLLLIGPYEPQLDPLKPETLQAIAQNPNIITTGYQADVRPYFAISHALVFPSYREGFPNVVMQAGAMGLPCIVTNINGCNEIIEEGKNGTITPVKDTQAVLEKMTRFLEDNTFYHHLKQNARTMICDHYEQQVVWEALLEEYNALSPPRSLSGAEV